MAVGRWMAECFTTTTKSKRSAHSVRHPGKEVTYTNFLSTPLIHTCTSAHTHAHTLDKLMNSARGGVRDQSGTCFTTMWDRLTQTTETAKRKGEKRIWEARRDKSWREWIQKRGKTRNKGENKMPNFTREDLELCLQSQVSCVCNCEGPCTGQSTTIKVVTLTGLVSSLYCQNCVFGPNLVCPWQDRIIHNQNCMKAGDPAATIVCGHVCQHDSHVFSVWDTHVAHTLNI